MSLLLNILLLFPNTLDELMSSCPVHLSLSPPVTYSTLQSEQEWLTDLLSVEARCFKLMFNPMSPLKTGAALPHSGVF